MTIDVTKNYVVTSKSIHCLPKDAAEGSNEWRIRRTQTASGFVEVEPGIWLPTKVRCVVHGGKNPKDIASGYIAKCENWIVNPPLNNGMFVLTPPPGSYVNDRVRGVSFAVKSLPIRSDVEKPSENTRAMKEKLAAMRSNEAIAEEFASPPPGDPWRVAGAALVMIATIVVVIAVLRWFMFC